MWLTYQHIAGGDGLQGGVREIGALLRPTWGRNKKMNDETKNNIETDATAEIEEAELATIADALRVRSGVTAGARRPLIPRL
jgi:hypothetical protein